MKLMIHRKKALLATFLILSMVCLLLLPAGCSKDTGTVESTQSSSVSQTSGQASTASMTSGQMSTTASTQVPTQSQAQSQEAIIQQFIVDENPDEDVKNILLSGLKEPSPVGTISKIREAFSQGTITEEESALLVMQAAFEPEQLPEQYNIDDVDGTGWDITAEAQWIQNNWPQFNEQQQAMFRPYYVSPDDPDSIFQQLNVSGNRSFLNWILPATPVYANSDPNRWGTELVSTDTYRGIVRVHYYDPNVTDAVNDQMQAKAMLVVEAIMKAWPMFKDLLKFEPNIYTDVFLVKFADPTLYGLTRWLSQHNRVEIQINKNLSGKLLQATTVHELFHCFQFHMSPVYQNATSDISWLMDVTATWSEHFVYPDYNTEHEYLDKYFGKLHHEMVQYNGKTEYERYMFPFFLTQYLGDASYVYRILKDVKDGADVRMGIMQSFPTYHDAFAQYALYNWNQDPWMAYQDIPKFPYDIPYGDSVAEFTESKGEAKEYTIPLQKGGIQYQCHAFTKDIEKIQKVKFSFRSINSDNQMRRQALIKIGDVWHLEQWDNLTEREFCRKNADENVKMVILVFSNANLTTTDSSYYKLDTTMACEGRVGGYTRITQTLDGGSILSVKATYESYDTIAYLEEEESSDWLYVLTERNVQFNFSQFGQWEMAGIPVNGSVTGSGVLRENYALDEEAPFKFQIKEDGGISFLVAPETIDREWVTMTYMMSSAGGTTSHSEKTGAVLQNLSGLVFDLDKSEIFPGKIMGKREFDSWSPFGPARTIVEFEYTLP